ncbi:LytR/AlgR family response regulator transcription factor [Pedobacter sp. MW01-1-1]|uniref:LytR/AlgR family response regulator transcription factor n=1 Tax=Pedobacter sp. MW01-1-1 TaxID=3383027 RepID=UPI003FEE4203
MPINCIAIDDDPHSLESLKDYLTTLPNLSLVDSYSEPLKALEAIRDSNQLDIVFLDIEMPSISGIELATLIRPKTKYLIFTTAHPRYAIDAFKVNADAYLLKPYSIMHFKKTIHNLYPTTPETINPLLIFDQSFFELHTDRKEESLKKIEAENFIVVENAEDNVLFLTTQTCYQAGKEKFKEVQEILTNLEAFIQINDSTIIAKNHLKNLLGSRLTLSNGSSYLVSSGYLASLIDFLNQNSQNNTPLN